MRAVVAVILTILLATPAYADIGPAVIKRAVSSAIATEAAEQARPNANTNENNPYYWPSIILMTAGGVVTLYGLTHDTGVECNSSGTSFACGTTKSKAVIFTGLGMVGVGAVLFGKTKSRPDLTFGPRAVGVRQQWTW